MVNIFVSFRFADGAETKDEICKCLKNNKIAYDYSEDVDRSQYTTKTIEKYLHEKICRASIIISVLTPQALNYKRRYSKIEDMTYDEVSYALQDRENNRSSGYIAVYTDEVEDMLIEKSSHTCTVCNIVKTTTIIKSIEHLFSKNMFNVSEEKKFCKCDNLYNTRKDHYCSLISVREFLQNPQMYVNDAISKRERIDDFAIVKRLN